MLEDYLAAVAAIIGPPDADAAVDLLRAALAPADADGTLAEALAHLGSPEEVVAKMRAHGAGHQHLDPVVLPDGTVVWAASASAGTERAEPPGFGLYLDPRWSPPWPHAHVDWPDFGLPADRAAFVAALQDLLARSRAGQRVEVACLGGHGRTGTALAALAVLTGVEGDPVAWVRAAYCDKAVETDDQAAFARSLRR